ncbi:MULTISPECIES: lysylphosphatidylglycerol synthase domain-containing protein [unclassified Caballeronia]|uniref:lysylphosphatidylglycerol synthase domain-containing protein n=1 Tax=unclassified Caballeronia TaxID=2646786 RepID=UPI002027E5AC|nr:MULTISPECIES: lysylphosphatidylglycerol synthase domain-containing protein [unclassified Caballeronia]
MSLVNQARLFLWAFGVSAVLFIGSLVLWLPVGWSRMGFPTGSALVWPVVLYAMAHGARMLRLGLLLGSIRIRKLLGLYLYTAACSAVVPFKLGELVRVNEFAWQQSGSLARGVVIVWVERVFDMVALGAIILVILTRSDVEVAPIAPVLWLSTAFVLTTLLFFFVLPEQLATLNLHVIRTYRDEKAVRVLKILERINDLSHMARPLLNGRILTLAFITLFIWCFELLALGLLTRELDSWNPLYRLVSQFADIIIHRSAHGASNDALVSVFDQWKVLILCAPGLIALVLFRKWRRTTSQAEGITR